MRKTQKNKRSEEGETSYRRNRTESYRNVRAFECGSMLMDHFRRRNAVQQFCGNKVPQGMFCLHAVREAVEPFVGADFSNLFPSTKAKTV